LARRRNKSSRKRNVWLHYTFSESSKLILRPHLFRAVAERTTINCKHLVARLPARCSGLPHAVSPAVCIDNSLSPSSMFPSLLVRHRRANPLSRGIISPVYATLELMCIKAPSPSIRFESKRVRCHVSRHAMPCRRVASSRVASRRVGSLGFIQSFTPGKKSALCNRRTSLRLCSRREWELEVISLRHNAR